MFKLMILLMFLTGCYPQDCRHTAWGQKPAQTVPICLRNSIDTGGEKCGTPERGWVKFFDATLDKNNYCVWWNDTQSIKCFTKNVKFDKGEGWSDSKADQCCDAGGGWEACWKNQNSYCAMPGLYPTPQPGRLQQVQEPGKPIVWWCYRGTRDQWQPCESGGAPPKGSDVLDAASRKAELALALTHRVLTAAEFKEVLAFGPALFEPFFGQGGDGTARYEQALRIQLLISKLDAMKVQK